MIPEGYQPSKRVVAVTLVMLGAFLIFAIYSLSKRYIALSGEVRYTISTTTKRYFTSSGRDVEYIYTVNGNIYEGIATYAYSSKVPGGKYWIKYSIKYPDISEIFQNMPVDPRIDTIPPDGFKNIYNYQQFLKWRGWAAKKKNFE